MLEEPRSPQLVEVDYEPFADGMIEGVVPTTEPQREIWLATQLGGHASLAYNESISLRFTGRLQADALQEALSGLLRRADAWRATFSPDGESMVVHEVAALPLAQHDLRRLDPEAREQAAARVRKDAVETPFDLEHGPMVRAQLLVLGDEAHELVLTAHHLVCDGWSMDVAKRDLARLYANAAGAGTHALAPPASWAAHARAEQSYAGSSTEAADSRYWMGKYARLPAPMELPLDRPRPRRRGFAAQCFVHELDGALLGPLKRAAGRCGASMFSTLLVSTAALLGRITRTDEVVIGVFSAGQALGEPHLMGHAVNLLPLRIQVPADAPFSGVLRAGQGELLDAIEHQRLPFGALLKKLRVARDPSRLPLMSVVFNLDQPPAADELDFAGLGVEQSTNYRSYDNFELFINAVQTRSGLRLEAQYSTDLFDESTVRSWMVALEVLLAGFAQMPDSPVGQLPWMDGLGKQRLQAWNATAKPVDPRLTLGPLIRRWAHDEPERLAVQAQDGALSYGQLEARSNQVARWLRERAVGRGHFVGVMLPRDSRMLVALLGVLKSGAAYVPLDPAYPVLRLAHMVSDAGLEWILADASQSVDPLGPAVKIASIDQAMSSDVSALGLAPDERLDAWSEDPAYVIYTSGSTGVPKGVVIPHRAVVNFLDSMADRPGLDRDDRLLAVTTLSFDIAVLELFLPLKVGARVVLASRSDVQDPRALRDTLVRESVTAMQATPTLWRLLIETGWSGHPGLKALVGGEALPRDLTVSLLERSAQVWNMYGPTETTVWSSAWEVPRDFAASTQPVFVGHPLANTSVWILDERAEICPPGVPGEICIGGAGLALGYLNRPELTAERFATLRRGVGLAANERLYRTGDLGRWHHSGVIEHLGRIDDQVKVRGHRIELGEIEAALSELPQVRQAAAVVSRSASQDPVLAVFVVPSSAPAFDAKLLRDQLRTRLPEYMLPQQFHALEVLPLLPNGKVDRASLVARLGLGAVTSASGHEMTRTTEVLSPDEGLVALAWTDVLGRSDLGLDDDFFDVGGHSMLAIRLMARLEQATGHRFALSVVLERPTIRSMAELLGRRASNEGEHVVSIRPGSGGTPVFLLHDGDGEVLLYRNLALGLHPRHPVYGVKPQAGGGLAMRATRIGDMAAGHVVGIRAVQAHGPYIVGGLCAGGVLAFEVARQLEAAGETVAMVALLDAANPRARLRAGRVAEARLKRFGASLQLNASSSVAGYVTRGLGLIGRKVGNAALYEVESRLERMQANRMVRQLRQHVEQGGELSDEAKALTVRQIYTLAEAEYLPGTVQADLCLFRARTGDGSEADKPEVEDYVDPDLGWRTQTRGILHVQDTPGGHSTMLQKPHVAHVVRGMQAFIDELGRSGLARHRVEVSAAK